MAGASESFAGHLREPLAEPELDEGWTSDRECDRLAPLAASLQHWAGVYERWRRHALACARPAQAPFGPADLAAIDGLRGVHFGQLAALGTRLRTTAAALTRIAEFTVGPRSAVAEAWRDDSAQRAVQRFDRFERDTRDCATVCARLGLHLECALADTVAPVVSSAVQEILARSGGWRQSCGSMSRVVWEQRIAELDAGHPAGPAGQWCVELDALVIDYDAAVGLFRATLDAAETTVCEVYRALRREFGAGGCGAGVQDLFGADPAGTAPGAAAPASADPASAESAPAATALASAGPAGADEPSSGSSAAGGGGGAGAPAGPGADGSAVLGELNELPVAYPGAATPAVPSDAVGYGAGAATAGAGAVSGAPAGFLGAAADDQPRTGRSWPPPVGGDREREASWARLRALLGDDAGERPEQRGTGR